MRMRMNNEDEISREARLRKEARELEAKGIKTEEVINEPEAEEELAEEEKTIPSAVPSVQKKLVRKKSKKSKRS